MKHGNRDAAAGGDDLRRGPADATLLPNVTPLPEVITPTDVSDGPGPVGPYADAAPRGITQPVNTPVEPDVPSEPWEPGDMPEAPERAPPTEADTPAGAPKPDPVVPSVALRVSIPDPQAVEEIKRLDAPVLPLEPMPAQEMPVAEEQKARSLWPEPQALMEQLDELAVECDTGAWAMEVDVTLRRLGTAMNDNRHEAAASLMGHLEALKEEAGRLAGQLEDDARAGKVLRAGYALDRRLLVWRQTLLAGGLRAYAGEAVRGDAGQLSACLAAVDALTRGRPQGRAWSEYLTLESLRELADGRTVTDDQDRAVAQAVLDRLARVPLNPRQRQFIAQRPVAALRSELRRWASQPVEFHEVLLHLEQYEKSVSAGDARLLGEDCQRLALSPSAPERQLGDWLESHYRNANVRLAVAGRLLNQLIPDRPDECQDVHDVIGGRPVHGESLTSTDIAVRLIPNAQRVRMALEITGEVSTLTRSVSGPATFYNDSQSQYRAWKELELGPRGMVLRPAQVQVTNDLRLREVSTDFDPIPLFGSLVQEIARSQHESRRCQMSAEVEEKVWARAKEQIDDEADARLRGLVQRLEGTLLEPLAALSLGPAVISAETTADRVTMRLRLASDEQLGGHTPRPRAPADSLASLQVHQSALNNVVDQLQLDGATFTLPELRRRLAERLRQPAWLSQETEHDDLRITFAAKDAVQVQCRDGRVTLLFSVARLEKDPYSWEDFQVRVSYRPEATGRSARLAREELIEVLGEDLSTRERMAVRGIFSKTLPRNRSLELIPERILNDPRLAGVRITQLEIDDGWLALALGPTRPAARTASSEGQASSDVTR